MIYTFICIVFGPLKSMKQSILPYNNFLIPYSHPKGQLLAKMVIFGHFLVQATFYTIEMAKKFLLKQKQIYGWKQIF